MAGHRHASAHRDFHGDEGQSVILVDVSAKPAARSRLSQPGIALERGADRVEQFGADDAAGLPDARHFGEVQIPVVGVPRLPAGAPCPGRRRRSWRRRARSRAPRAAAAVGPRSAIGRMLGPFSFWLAATRACFIEDIARAKTAASIVGIGVPSSSAFWRSSGRCPSARPCRESRSTRACRYRRR